MAIVIFDADNKLHHDLFESFKKDIVSDIYTKEHIYCQYFDYVDEIEIILLNLAVEELGLDEEFDEYCTLAIYNTNPNKFGIVAGLEFIDYETEALGADFLKFEGQIFVENDKTVILDIDPSSLDYASSREFDKARQTYQFK